MAKLARPSLGEEPPDATVIGGFEADVEGDWYYSPYLHRILDLLRSFRFRNDDSQLRELMAVHYLETILDNTATIVHQLGATITKEAHVYDSVRVVLQAVFPGMKDANSNFSKIHKHYKANVLVPEARAVVEYKYANSETDLKSFFGQIKDDEVGYTGDHRYSRWYSVFYLTEAFWGKSRFLKVWDEMQITDAWTPVYVVGNSGVSPKKRAN